MNAIQPAVWNKYETLWLTHLMGQRWRRTGFQRQKEGSFSASFKSELDGSTVWIRTRQLSMNYGLQSEHLRMGFPSQNLAGVDCNHQPERWTWGVKLHAAPMSMKAPLLRCYRQDPKTASVQPAPACSLLQETDLSIGRCLKEVDNTFLPLRKTALTKAARNSLPNRPELQESMSDRFKF